MHDIEVVLRFCAYRLHLGDYGDYGSLSELLTATTSELDNKAIVSDSKLASLEKDFDLAMRNAITVFGSDAFRKATQKPINRALFDVWSYAFSLIPAEVVARKAELITSEALQLMQDSSFNDSVSLNTSDPSRVAYRFSSVLKELKKIGVLND